MKTHSEHVDGLHRSLSPGGRPLGQIGNLVTRLAACEADLHAAQQIRYQVFRRNYSADQASRQTGGNLDRDAHDRLCDHLLVSEIGETGDEQIVGTQRFYMSGDENESRFYSQAEFDVASLRKSRSRLIFMELGRSCILPNYRNKRTMELLWQGTWAYAVDHSVDVMIGCASFPTTKPDEIATSLRFLHDVAGCEPEWSVAPNSPDVIDMATLSGLHEPESKALRGLPPLIKGYLRLGAMFSRHAVIDPDFGTIDVLVVLPVARISPRYLKYYGADANRHRAA